MCRVLFDVTEHKELITKILNITVYRLNVRVKCLHLHRTRKHSTRIHIHLRVSTCVNKKSYDPHVINLTTADELNEAENMIQNACAKFGVAAVVGGPHIAERGQTFNSALLVSETGHTVGRQHKMQLVGDDASWCSPGESLNVFRLGGVPVSVIICHDKRYPELVRYAFQFKKVLVHEFLSCTRDWLLHYLIGCALLNIFSLVKSSELFLVKIWFMQRFLGPFSSQ